MSSFKVQTAELLQVQYEWMITSYYRVEFNCLAAMQGAHKFYI